MSVLLWVHTGRPPTDKSQGFLLDSPGPSVVFTTDQHTCLTLGPEEVPRFLRRVPKSEVRSRRDLPSLGHDPPTSGPVDRLE